MDGVRNVRFEIQPILRRAVADGGFRHRAMDFSLASVALVGVESDDLGKLDHLQSAEGRNHDVCFCARW